MRVGVSGLSGSSRKQHCSTLCPSPQPSRLSEACTETVRHRAGKNKGSFLTSIHHHEIATVQQGPHQVLCRLEPFLVVGQDEHLGKLLLLLGRRASQGPE